MKSRAWSLIVGCLLLVCACAPSTAAPTAAPLAAPTAQPKTRTQITFVSTAVTGAYAGLWTAIEAGYFAEEGIDIQITSVDSTSRGIAVLLSGEAQFSALDGQTVIQANLKGGDLRAVAAATNHLVFSVMADPSIQAGPDLKGKRVGITSHGSSTETAALQALAIWKLDPSDVALVPLNSAPNVLTGLMTKQLDAAVLSPPTNSRARAAGYREILNLATDGPEYPSVTLGATRSYLTNNREVALGFVRAYSRGIHRFKTDQPFAVQALAKYLNLEDQAILEDTRKQFSVIFEDVPYVNPKGVQHAIETVALTQPEAATAAPDAFVDSSFVKQLEDSGFYKQLLASR
jgi:NitT/TauT family transport system substrate-binding protein